MSDHSAIRKDAMRELCEAIGRYGASICRGDAELAPPDYLVAAWDRISALLADRDALERDLAAAREDAERYRWLKRNARRIDFAGLCVSDMGQLDARIAATPERPPAHPEWTVCPRCENKIAKCDCATPEREPDVADFIARQKPMPPEIGEAINRNLDRLMDDANECEPGAARSPIQNANESLREQKERELDALLRRGGDA
jgi:hypothetical protein